MNGRRKRFSGPAIACGFTIVEILFVVAILGILAAIAGTVYTHYYDPRARASEVIEQYDALRTTLQEDFQSNGMRQDCGGLVELARGKLQSPYVKLDLGTLPVDQNDPTKGHRAVLTVTGTLQDHAARGVQIARAVHDEMVRNGVVVGKPILTDSIVLFSLRLSDGPMCQIAMSAGGGGAVSATVPCPNGLFRGADGNCHSATPTNPLQTRPQPQGGSTPSIVACPPDQERMEVPGPLGTPVAICLDKCPPGQTRDPVNYTVCAAPKTQVQPQGSSTPSTAACPPDQERMQVPGSLGTPVSICLDKCPPGQTRDPVNYTICTAPATQPPAQLQQQTGTTGATGAATGPAGGATTGPGGGATTGSGGVSRQQCERQCRVQYPHGNSIGYRNCVAACQ